jgi:hypothetical protein
VADKVVVVDGREVLAALEGPAVKGWLEGGLGEHQLCSHSKAARAELNCLQEH